MTHVVVILLLVLSFQLVQMKEEDVTLRVVEGKPVIIKCRLPMHLKDIKDAKLQWSKDMFGLDNGTLTDVYKYRIMVPNPESTGIFDLHFKSTETEDQGLFGCHIDITLTNGTTINVLEKTYLKIITPPTMLEIKPKVSDSDTASILWLPSERTVWGIQNQHLILSCISKNKTNPIAKMIWTVGSQYGRYEIGNSQSDDKVNIKLSPKMQNSTASCGIRNKNDFPGAHLPNTNYTIRVLYFSQSQILRDDAKFDSQIRDGDMATFICKTSTAKEASVYYSWYIQFSGQQFSNHYLVNDSTSNSITLKISQKYHRGFLHCLVRSTIRQSECDRVINRNCELQLVKDVKESLPFNILYPPKIANPFENVTVTHLGEWVTLHCDVDSNPTVMVKWFKTNIGTTKNARSMNWYHQTEISNLIDNLRIENIVISGSYHKFQILNDQDFDIYICEAKSTIFESAYKYVVVAREEETSIKSDRSVIKVQEGGSASLMCLVEGWPRPPSGSIKWHHTDSQMPLIFNERMHVVNKNQLMAFESKLYFKNVVNSDFGSYNCSVSDGTKKISKRLDLQPIKDPLIVFMILGGVGIFFVILAVTIIVCISRKLYKHKKKKNKKVGCNDYSSPIQTTALTSPTMDSSIENDMLYNRFNSLQSFQKNDSFNESMASKRCFVYNNKQQILRMPSIDSRNGQYDMSNSKGNERSWDSGVGPDDAIYRNGQMLPYPKGSRCISPFSTQASSNNSIGPVNLNNLINNRYWQPIPSSEMMNQQNTETSSNRFSNTDQGSLHSSFIPSNIDGSVPLISTSGNQSFVCIPIEEYQQHIRLLQESRAQPSVHSFSSTSFPNNNESTEYNHNYKLYNGDTTPTENSVKSISINSKP